MSRNCGINFYAAKVLDKIMLYENMDCSLEQMLYCEKAGILIFVRVLYWKIKEGKNHFTE